MMRVTNSMIVKRTKSNINANRAQVDYTNNQMSTQKKITKPSDNPIIAIRSLRLRSTLSTITQYYRNNISDAESWMDCTGTALKNMEDLLDDAYSRVVYGATDELQPEDRHTIYKALQSLQQQIYCEGNADYARRTVFTGFKTNENLTFMSDKEGKEEEYEITERFDYKDVDKKNYYPESFDDTSDANVATAGNHPDVFNEVTLNRLRLAYDNITPGGDKSKPEQQNALTISYGDSSVTLSSDQTKIVSQGCTFTASANPDELKIEPPEGYFAVYTVAGTEAVIAAGGSHTIPATDGDTYTVTLYKNSDYSYTAPTPPATTGVITKKVQSAEEPKKTTPVKYNNPTGATPPSAYLTTNIKDSEGNDMEISYKVSNTTELKKNDYKIDDGTTTVSNIIFDQESGELIFGDKLAKAFDTQRASFTFDYHKKGFEEGELRPEYYFDCTRYMEDRSNIKYENFDENGEWKTQAIYYNIAGGQQMQINTEGREVFNSDIRRDLDELIDIVNMAIKAQTTVDSIKEKIESGNYTGDALESLNKWYDAAKKQQDYANQNMHDTYSAYITRFQGYLDTVNLEITDLGGRSERVELTKSRMSVQESTFKELKSINEDMDLSDLVINYTAASVAYQAALQAAAKIGKMTLLDFI